MGKLIWEVGVTEFGVDGVWWEWNMGMMEYEDDGIWGVMKYGNGRI